MLLSVEAPWEVIKEEVKRKVVRSACNEKFNTVGDFGKKVLGI
jgi:hypothetical protein